MNPRILKKVVILVSLFLFHVAYSQNYIDVKVIGLSDGKRDSKQQDREEAIVNAKLQAIEKAGVNIKSVTVVENFMLKKDWIESESNAYLQPGFEVLDMGYGEDGVYKVVLIGKVSTALSPQAFVTMPIQVKTSSDINYKIYFDDKFLAEKSGNASIDVSDLGVGKHSVKLIAPDEWLLQLEPEWKYDSKISEDIFLEVGKPNSILFKPIFKKTGSLKEINIGDYPDKFNISYTDVFGETHKITGSIHYKSPFFGKTKITYKIYHNDILIFDKVNPKADNDILFENSAFKIIRAYMNKGINHTLTRKDL